MMLYTFILSFTQCNVSDNYASLILCCFRCMLHNFGGNIEMYGILDAISSGSVDARVSENSTMVQPMFLVSHLNILSILVLAIICQCFLLEG